MLARSKLSSDLCTLNCCSSASDPRTDPRNPPHRPTVLDLRVRLQYLCRGEFDSFAADPRLLIRTVHDSSPFSPIEVRMILTRRSSKCTHAKVPNRPGFFSDWWNSTTFDEFSRRWNVPVSRRTSSRPVSSSRVEFLISLSYRCIPFCFVMSVSE